MSSPNLTLHHLQVGQGERITWLLEELNIPYTLELHKRSPLLSPPSLKEKYPIGASPLLEDFTADAQNPVVLAESGAIAEYIIYKYADGRLALKPDHKNYADYLYWFHFQNSTLQNGLMRLAFTRSMVGEEDPRYKGNAERASVAINHINNRLLENKWLAGEEFSAADVMTGWCFTTMRKFEPLDLTPYEGILGWLKRVGEREAYRRAMQKSDPELNVEEGLSAKGPPLFEAWAKAMGVKLTKEKL